MKLKQISLLLLSCIFAISLLGCPQAKAPEQPPEPKTVTLTFELDGGSTTTELTEGKLTGKEDSTLSIEEPTKKDYAFAGWEPALPTTFPEDDTTYTAKWLFVYNIGDVVLNDGSVIRYNES